MDKINGQAATQETQEQELARLRAENAKLRNKAVNGMKVTDKGGVSLYGLGRFPVTLYKSQWLELLDQAEGIRQFINENDHRLAQKQDKTASVAKEVKVG